MRIVPRKVLLAIWRNDRQALRELGAQGSRERIRRAALHRAEARRTKDKDEPQDFPQDLGEYLRQSWVIDDAADHIDNSGQPLDD